MAGGTRIGGGEGACGCGVRERGRGSKVRFGGGRSLEGRGDWGGGEGNGNFIFFRFPSPLVFQCQSSCCTFQVLSDVGYVMRSNQKILVFQKIFKNTGESVFSKLRFYFLFGKILGVV